MKMALGSSHRKVTAQGYNLICLESMKALALADGDYELLKLDLTDI